MTGIHISIRLDLPSGNRIGPSEIALLEAIRAEGSITGAARYLGIAYRTGWLLVQEINQTLQEPAVSTKHRGVKRSGAVVTSVGEKVIELYHSIEGMTSASAHQEFQSKALDTDDTFSFTFTKAGTYEYFCSVHPMMTGKIVVQ